MTLVLSPLTQKLSFADYLTYDDDSDTRYELVEGDLIPMSLATGKHGAMVRLLTQQFEAQIQTSGQPWLALPGLVGIRIPRGGRWDTARIPDVTVLTTDGWQALADREAMIDYEDPAPLLVVEVVSPSTQSTDYRAKRTEYAVRDIPEYWIVDPLASKVTVCTLDDRLYDLSEYQGSEPIRSGTFANLALTVQQVMEV